MELFLRQTGCEPSRLAALRRFFTLLTGEAQRTPDPRPPDVALVPLWASRLRGSR
jgi:hypothetical protein